MSSQIYQIICTDEARSLILIEMYILEFIWIWENVKSETKSIYRSSNKKSQRKKLGRQLQEILDMIFSQQEITMQSLKLEYLPSFVNAMENHNQSRKN